MAEANATQLCIQCGRAIALRINETTGLESKANRRYCTPACASSHRNARRAPRPSRGKKCRPTKSASCFVCSVSFQSYPSRGAPGGWTACCSVRCSRISRRIRDGSILGRYRVSVCVRRGKCATCGKGFEVTGAASYCSETCRPSACEWVPAERGCAVCGQRFVQERKWQRSCSPECEAEVDRKAARVAKSRRRARIRNAEHHAIDPLAVFARDGWRCRLCGERTPKSLRGTYEPRAPELDHIVPLAAGGGHTWCNVQCSCRRCNGAKGAHPLGQLGLPLGVEGGGRALRI